MNAAFERKINTDDRKQNGINSMEAFNAITTGALVYMDNHFFLTEASLEKKDALPELQISEQELLAYIHPDYINHVEALFSALKTGEVLPSGFKLKIKTDKEEKLLLVAAYYVNINAKSIGIINFIDIEKLADNNKAALALIDYEKKFKELDAAKGKFFSILSHDLKSPFNSILGFSNILIEEADQLSSDEIKKYTQYIASASENLFFLVENLQLWSALKRGKLEIASENISINTEAGYVLKKFRKNASDKNISLLNKIDKKICAKADVSMLHAVLKNLIYNAIKYTSSGGVITVDAELNNDVINISVADTGVGIKAQDIDKIKKNDLFFSTKGTDNETGAGLGLILSEELVKENNGQLWFETQVNKGSVFYFSLPAGKQFV